MSIVPIVIPAYEPDNRLIELIEQLNIRNMGPIIVVDDGSGVEYLELFKKVKNLITPFGGFLLTHDVNRGKGRALKTAFEYLRDNNEIIGVVTADSDGQHTPDCIQSIVSRLLEEDSRLILGVRDFDSDNIPWKSRFGNKLTEKIFYYLTGNHVADTQTGLRGIPRNLLERMIAISGERFEYEMRALIEIAEQYGVIEVPIETVYDSQDNHQTHFRPIKDSIMIYRILGERFMKFVISSLSSSVIDLSLFWIICNILNMYIATYVYIVYATVLARIISATYNYLVNYVIVFNSNENHRKALFKYVVLAFCQMSLSAGSVYIMCGLLAFIPQIVIKIVIDTILFLISYRVQKEIVYKIYKGSVIVELEEK